MSAGKEKPLVAISRCLLGEPVRYDGRHKDHPELVAAIQHHCEVLPVCPEVEAGLSTPRPPVQLVQQRDGTFAALGRDDPKVDVSAVLQHYSTRFPSTGLSGAILQNRSPSCGIGDTPYYSMAGIEQGVTDGLFTTALRSANPRLPITTPQQLQSTAAIDHFLEQVKQFQSTG